MSRLAKTDEITKIVDLKKQRLYAMVRAGTFPAGVIVMFGRQIRWNVDELEVWISNGGTIQKQHPQIDRGSTHKR
jgi:predicted DNA-binding transcriptional regulator AlpA